MSEKQRKTLRIGVPIPPEKPYTNYFEALRALGAEGVVVAADTDPSGFDGLLLPGGGDLAPERYHQENRGSKGIDEALDTLQLTAADRFIRAGVPAFGICRGHQLLNVLFGGTLIQHLETLIRHPREENSTEDQVHAVTAVPGSWIEGLYGHVFSVNSSHHQAVDVPGDGMVMDLYAEEGVVEAMHHASLPIWSVQWHPERMSFAFRRQDTVDGEKVLRYFLEQCEKHRQGRK